MILILSLIVFINFFIYYWDILESLILTRCCFYLNLIVCLCLEFANGLVVIFLKLIFINFEKFEKKRMQELNYVLQFCQFY